MCVCGGWGVGGRGASFSPVVRGLRGYTYIHLDWEILIAQCMCTQYFMFVLSVHALLSTRRKGYIYSVIYTHTWTSPSAVL